MEHNNFFGVLYKNLLENEFLLIDKFFDKSKIDDKSEYVGLYKYVGNFVYFVVLINESVCDDYKYRWEVLKQQVKSIALIMNVSNVIFLSIIITKNADNDICDFAETFYYDRETSYNDLCWIADYSGNKIISGKYQPNKILNIHKIICNSFEEKSEIKEVNFYEVYENIKSEKNKLLKSDSAGVTFLIMIVNFIIFALMELNGGSENTENLIRFGAVSAELVFENKEFYRMFTDMFVHIGFAHIASNSLSLYILGTRCEKYFGGVLFFIIYILSGVGASMGSILFTGGLSAGASGAIFGIMGAMLTYSVINKKSMGDFSAYFMVIFSLVNIGAGFIMDGVDNAGHIGGFIMGILLSFIVITLKL